VSFYGRKYYKNKLILGRRKISRFMLCSIIVLNIFPYLFRLPPSSSSFLLSSRDYPVLTGASPADVPA
jgi:hypothetical protein